MRVYISGPMTGLPELNFPAFNAAAAALREAGFEVVNPAEINPDGRKTWAQCMRADIRELCTCDALALLQGWEGSQGAHLELQLAHRLGMTIAPVEKLLKGVYFTLGETMPGTPELKAEPFEIHDLMNNEELQWAIMGASAMAKNIGPDDARHSIVHAHLKELLKVQLLRAMAVHAVGSAPGLVRESQC